MNKKYIGLAALSIIITMAIIICCHCIKKKNKPLELDSEVRPRGSTDSITLDETPQPEYRAINGSDYSSLDKFDN